jgi:hypothetical protein
MIKLHYSDNQEIDIRELIDSLLDMVANSTSIVKIEVESENGCECCGEEEHVTHSITITEEY